VVDALRANRFRFLCAITLLFALFTILMLSAAASNTQELAFSTISNAEKSVGQAYKAVLNAETVGANVTGLLTRLNYAACLLSEAQVTFEAGNFEEATRLAELASGVGSEVSSEAERLRVEAEHAQVERFWWSVTGSGLTVAIVSCVSFLGYRYFKRRYYGQLLKMRPRVDYT